MKKKKDKKKRSKPTEKKLAVNISFKELIKTAAVGMNVVPKRSK